MSSSESPAKTVLVIHGISDPAPGRTAWELASRACKGGLRQTWVPTHQDPPNQMVAWEGTLEHGPDATPVRFVDMGWSDLSPAPNGQIATLWTIVSQGVRLPAIFVRELAYEARDTGSVVDAALAYLAYLQAVMGCVVGPGMAASLVVLALLLAAPAVVFWVGPGVALGLALAWLLGGPLSSKHWGPLAQVGLVVAFGAAGGGLGFLALPAAGDPLLTWWSGVALVSLLVLGVWGFVSGFVLGPRFRPTTDPEHLLPRRRPLGWLALGVFLGMAALRLLRGGLMGMGSPSEPLPRLAADQLPLVATVVAWRSVETVGECVVGFTALLTFGFALVAVLSPKARRARKTAALAIPLPGLIGWVVTYLFLVGWFKNLEADPRLVRCVGSECSVVATGHPSSACSGNLETSCAHDGPGARGVLERILSAPTDFARDRFPPRATCGDHWPPDGLGAGARLVDCLALGDVKWPSEKACTWRLAFDDEHTCTPGLIGESRPLPGGRSWDKGYAPWMLARAPLGQSDLALFVVTAVGLCSIAAAVVALHLPGLWMDAGMGGYPASETGRFRTRADRSREVAPQVAAALACGWASSALLILVLDKNLDLGGRMANAGFGEAVSALAGIAVGVSGVLLSQASTVADLLQDSLRFLDEEDGKSMQIRDRVRAAVLACRPDLILAHSQGTMLVAMCADVTTRVPVLLCGSPLKAIYWRFLPRTFAAVCHGLCPDPNGDGFLRQPERWQNRYFDTDYVGRELWAGDQTLGSGGHTGYFAHPEVINTVRGLLPPVKRP